MVHYTQESGVPSPAARGSRERQTRKRCSQVLSLVWSCFPCWFWRGFPPPTPVSWWPPVLSPRFLPTKSDLQRRDGAASSSHSPSNKRHGLCRKNCLLVVSTEARSQYRWETHQMSMPPWYHLEYVSDIILERVGPVMDLNIKYVILHCNDHQSQVVRGERGCNPV